MNSLSILQIAELSGAKLEQGDGKISIERISTDSRTIKKGELFVALRGENFDGHKFVEATAQAGAAGAIVDLKWNGKIPAKFAIIRADRSCELSESPFDQSPRHHRQQWKDKHERFCRFGSRSKISCHENAGQLQ
jgi:hypothetical protein